MANPESVSSEVTIVGPRGDAVLLPVVMALAQLDILSDVQIQISAQNVVKLHIWGHEEKRDTLEVDLLKAFAGALVYLQNGREVTHALPVH